MSVYRFVGNSPIDLEHDGDAVSLVPGSVVDFADREGLLAYAKEVLGTDLQDQTPITQSLLPIVPIPGLPKIPAELVIEDEAEPDLDATLSAMPSTEANPLSVDVSVSTEPPKHFRRDKRR